MRYFFQAQSMEVTVADGEIQSAYYLGSVESIPIENENVRTFDELFDSTEELINQHQVSVAYNRKNSEPSEHL